MGSHKETDEKVSSEPSNKNRNAIDIDRLIKAHHQRDPPPEACDVTLPRSQHTEIAISEPRSQFLITYWPCSDAEWMTKEGHSVRFFRRRGRWYAHTKASLGHRSTTTIYPVVCRHDLQAYLSRLRRYPYPGRWIRSIACDHGRALVVGSFGLCGGGDQLPRRRRLERSTSCALHAALTGGTIDSTASLVSELNADRPLSEKRILLEWMNGYIVWFSKQQTEGLTSWSMKEYCLLSDVRSNDATTADCLHRWFCSLCNRLHHGDYTDGIFVDAIDAALQSVDRRIFRDDPSVLIKLCTELLSKLDPASSAYTRETFPTQSGVLFALYRAVLTVEQIAPKQLNAYHPDGLYQKFNRRLTAILKMTSYYPFVYYCRLIESGLHRLKSESKSHRPRRMMHGMVGTLYVFRSLRAMLVFDFDIESLEHGIDRLVVAFADLKSQKAPWYDWMQALCRAAVSTFNAGYDHFDRCYRMMKHETNGLRRSDDRKALRFGMILQFRTLALHGKNETIQGAAIRELVTLAEGCKTHDGWSDDPEIVEALLNALSAVHRHYSIEDVAVAIELLTSIEDASVQSFVQAWLHAGDRRSNWDSHEDISPQDQRLFRLVQKELLSSVSASASLALDRSRLRTMLEAYYQRPQFTNMEPLFEGEPELHIMSVQYQLMLLEQTVIKDNEMEEEENVKATDEEEHHLSHHYERQEWIKTPIVQDALFLERPLEPDSEKSEIHRVLITGDPGTGKTTLARHLAFSWATCRWGQQFDFVFFLQVRELQSSKYNDANERREETLATAVVNSCFPRQSKDAFLDVRRQIEDVLDCPTTLIILDGLDEAAGSSQSIIADAKNGKHKLVMLGRPYGVQSDRSSADIEVELSGLSDVQLERLIETALPPNEGTAMTACLRVSPAVWNIAHIPVNATILCTLWKDPHINAFKAVKSSSLSVLYRRMTYFTWERYLIKMKEETQDVIDVFDTLGMIAYEALMQGQILIDEWLVMENTRTSQMKRILRESGFLLLKAFGGHYHFPHLTFQEYFAGRWLARQFCRGTMDEVANVEEMLVQQKYDAELKMVLGFMMGEVTLMKGSKGAERMMEQINREPSDVIGIQHLLLELRLIDSHLAATRNNKDVLKFDTVDRLTQIVLGSHLEYALASMLMECLKSLPNLVQRCPRVLAPMLTMCEWPKRFQKLAMGTLVTLLPFVPDRLQETVDHLESLFCRSDERLREEIVRCVRHLLEEFPDRGDVLMPLLKIACNDADHVVREAAPMGLVELMPRVSDCEKVLLIEKLGARCEDELYTVRKAALVSIDKCISMDATSVPALLEKIVKMLWDPYAYIREASMELSKKMAGVSDDAGRIIIDRLKEATNASPGIAQHAFEAIGELLHVMPLQLSSVTGALLSGSHHWSSSVRESAIQTISHGIRLDSTICPTLLPAIEHGLQANAYAVRKASIKALGDITSHCTDSDRHRIEEHLIQGFKDPEFLVRLATVEAVGEVIKHDLERIDVFRHALKSSAEDKVYTVRKASIEVFGYLSSQQDALNEDLMVILMHACKDPYTHVRKSALDWIVRILHRSPEIMDRLIDDLKGYSHRRSHGRKGAIETVAELMKFSPERTDEFVELLAEAFHDADHHVRLLMLQTLGSVAKLPASQIPSLAANLFDACLDDASIVRNVALQRFKELLDKHPKASLVMFDAVKKLTTDHRLYRRRVAFLIMAEIVRHRPDVISNCIPLIRGGFRDESNLVREAALVIVQMVMRIDREQFSKLMDLISIARDGISRVRAAAVRLIDTALEIASDVFYACIDQAIDACTDSSFTVRKCAFRLADRAIALSPELIPQFLPSLVEAFHNPNQQWRHGCEQVIQRIPLEALMECYWNAPWKEGLASLLVSRLYHVPLTIRRSAGKCTIVLHRLATKPTEWAKKEEEVTEMLDVLRTVYQERIGRSENEDD